MSTKGIIADMKDLVGKGNLEGLKEYYGIVLSELDESSHIAVDLVYKDVYLHACLKKQKPIVDWLLEVYETLDEITKVALKQLFPYGRYLLNK
jgi:hypothetical protein